MFFPIHAKRTQHEASTWTSLSLKRLECTQTLGTHQAHDRHLANRSQHSKSAHLLSIPIGTSRSVDGTRDQGQSSCSFHFNCQQLNNKLHSRLADRPHTSRPAAVTLIGQFNQRDFSKCYHLFLCFVHFFSL